jgi:hypothetical protein
VLAVSKEERLVILTNDEDFASVPSGKVFAVVLLRIPQRDVKTLLAAFKLLLSECDEWKGRIIVLTAAGWKAERLSQNGGGRR